MVWVSETKRHKESTSNVLWWLRFKNRAHDKPGALTARRWESREFSVWFVIKVSCRDLIYTDFREGLRDNYSPSLRRQLLPAGRAGRGAKTRNKRNQEILAGQSKPCVQQIRSSNSVCRLIIHNSYSEWRFYFVFRVVWLATNKTTDNVAIIRVRYIRKKLLPRIGYMSAVWNLVFPVQKNISAADCKTVG